MCFVRLAEVRGPHDNSAAKVISVGRAVAIQ